jgi:MFS family permease
MIKNLSAITASSYLSMLFLGVAGTLVGAAARNIGLSPFEIGLMITIQNIGFMLSVMVSGAMADSYPKPRILFIGSLILSAAFLTFYLTQIFNLNLFIMLMIGVGIGTYEGVTDAMLIDIHPQKESLHDIDHYLFDISANGLENCNCPIWTAGHCSCTGFRVDETTTKHKAY